MASERVYPGKWRLAHWEGWLVVPVIGLVWLEMSRGRWDDFRVCLFFEIMCVVAGLFGYSLKMHVFCGLHFYVSLFLCFFVSRYR